MSIEKNIELITEENEKKERKQRKKDKKRLVETEENLDLEKKSKKPKRERVEQSECIENETSVEKKKSSKKERKEKKKIDRPRTRSMDAKENKENTIENTVENKDDEIEKKEEIKSSSALSNFRISEQTAATLRKRGIESLFPIQCLTFDKIYDGKDLIGRARTGMGKTLAFALPVIERLLKDGISTTRGRKPRVICLAPTRELAKQVATEFETSAPTLSTVCIYGGTSYDTQNNAFRKGIDILVGTTGRVIDHIERGNLLLDSCKYLILDEADTMLEMGFREDIQKIFQAMNLVENKRQTLLFSATLPTWVQEVAQTYMSKDREYVDLVKEGDNQASNDVQHIAIPCHWEQKPDTMADLLSIYTKKGSRTIIFAETKKDCNELAVHSAIKVDCQVLHGDIAQSQRETTMQAFRDGKLSLLIATDVAARGLDMNVDLVINSEPPKTYSGRPDVDTYVHRSGRTGRAGKKGICITLYTPRQKELIQIIEHSIGNKFIHKGAPQPEEMIVASANEAFDQISKVHEDMIQIFNNKAIQLIEELGAEKALAAALACVTGYTQPMQRKSLLSGAADCITVLFKSSTPIHSTRYVWNAVNREFPSDISNSIKKVAITTDSLGACFDIPCSAIQQLEKLIALPNSQYSIATTLPTLKDNNTSSYSSYGGGGRGYSRGGGSNGRSFGSSRGRFNSSRGRFNNNRY